MLLGFEYWLCVLDLDAVKCIKEELETVSSDDIEDAGF